jgi:hypothetical protein
MNDNDIELITSLIAGELSPVEQEEGIARVEASPQLRSAYDEQLSVVTALRAEPRVSMTAAEHGRLNATLRAELHIEEAAAAPAAAVASGWNRWWAPLTGLATAAVIIIAVVVAPNVFDDDGSTGVASAPSAMTTTPTLASDPLAGAAEDTDTSQGGEQQADTSEGVEERAAASPTTVAATVTELDAPDTSSFSLKAAPDAPASLELPVLGDDVDIADVESATRRATEQATVDYAAISRCFGSAGEATGEAVIVGSVTQSGHEVVAVVTVAATGEEIVLTINLATCGVTSAG